MAGSAGGGVVVSGDGDGLSGVGSKAGGPDYLHQLLDPRATSENTVRQGFAPEA